MPSQKKVLKSSSPASQAPAPGADTKAAIKSCKYRFSLNIAPRLQWNENSGYCGETSFISAGMNYGQYCSQFTARALASPGLKQSNPNSQLLIGGGNDVSAARKMRLQASEFQGKTHGDTHGFLAWVKSHLLAGHVPIIGVFNDGILLGEWTGRDDGDNAYDHIVPVLGFGSHSPLKKSADTYIDSDVIVISDNGLYGPFGNPQVYPFFYYYELKGFQGTRRQANNPKGPVYMLKNVPRNYGITIEGVLDLDAVTIPVSLTSNTNYEPDIGHHSNKRPAPIDIQLTATVSIPDQTVAYNLYRYDDFNKVPVAGFNAAAANAVQAWVIPSGLGPTMTVVVDAKSDQTVVFRTVPASAS